MIRFFLTVLCSPGLRPGSAKQRHSPAQPSHQPLLPTRFPQVGREDTVLVVLSRWHATPDLVVFLRLLSMACMHSVCLRGKVAVCPLRAGGPLTHTATNAEGIHVDINNLRLQLQPRSFANLNSSDLHYANYQTHRFVLLHSAYHVLEPQPAFNRMLACTAGTYRPPCTPCTQARTEPHARILS